jgi:drug/metabolite transporter (DMT)-like permease
LPLALPFEASGHDIAMMAAFGALQLALPLMLYFYAARYISAPTLIFVVLIDAVFAPIWVWLGFDEVPARLAFIGAAIILVSVAFNAGLGVHKLRRAHAAD